MRKSPLNTQLGSFLSGVLLHLHSHSKPTKLLKHSQPFFYHLVIKDTPSCGHRISPWKDDSTTMIDDMWFWATCSILLYSMALFILHPKTGPARLIVQWVCQDSGHVWPHEHLMLHSSIRRVYQKSVAHKELFICIVCNSMLQMAWLMPDRCMSI